MELSDTTQALNDRITAGVPATDPDRTQMSSVIECPVCRTQNGGYETYCSECGFLLASTPGAPAEEQAAESGYGLIEDRTGRRFPLVVGENLVGRENAEILLMDGTVSRRHALLTLGDTGLTVTDLASTNGTQIDGVPVSPQTPAAVAGGSVLRFGQVTLRLEAPGSAPLPSEPTMAIPIEQRVAAAAKSAAAPIAILRSNGAHSEDIAVRGAATSIGRRPQNDHAISGDPFVSGAHARVEIIGGTITLTDVGSTNGTFVNGARLQAHQPCTLADGDEIQIGKGLYTLERNVVPEPTDDAQKLEWDEAAAERQPPPADSAASGSASTGSASTSSASTGSADGGNDGRTETGPL